MPKVELDNIRLSVSPMTDRVYAGIVAANPRFWKHKKDINNDFIDCVVKRWENHTEIIENEDGSSKWEITVKKIK